MAQLTMVSTDNPASAGHSKVGTSANFSYNGSIFLFGSLRSSTVKSITVQDENITIQTRNTEYKFVRKYD